MQRQALENSLDDVQRELIQARAEKTEAAGSKAVLETKVEDLQVNFDTVVVFFCGWEEFFRFQGRMYHSYCKVFLKCIFYLHPAALCQKKWICCNIPRLSFGCSYNYPA